MACPETLKKIASDFKEMMDELNKDRDRLEWIGNNGAYVCKVGIECWICFIDDEDALKPFQKGVYKSFREAIDAAMSGEDGK